LPTKRNERQNGLAYERYGTPVADVGNVRVALEVG
jgi:hypothetical protein